MPESANQILLIVLFWIGVTIAIAQLFESSWIRWGTLLGSVIVFGWAIWPIWYRLGQYQQEQYARNRNNKQ